MHHSTLRMFQRTLDDYTYAQEHYRSGGGGEGVFGVRVADVTVRYDYRRTYPSSTLNPRNLPVRYCNARAVLRRFNLARILEPAQSNHTTSAEMRRPQSWKSSLWRHLGSLQSIPQPVAHLVFALSSHCAYFYRALNYTLLWVSA
jgi:hypothetical protein